MLSHWAHRGKSQLFSQIRKLSSSTHLRQSNMSEHALRNGESLPPPNRDLMRVYSMRFCPFAQRTRIVLLHKQIPHETVNVNLKYKADWFLARNPLGLVPVLEYKGEIVYESIVCDDFLDELYPNNKLNPACPFQNSKDRILMHHFDATIPRNIYGVLNPKRATESREAFAKGLDILEKGLGNKRFFGGDSPSMCDFHVYPWFERFPCILELSKLTMSDDFAEYDPMPQAKYPQLNRWLQEIQRLPEVKDTILDTPHHMQFMMSLKQKKPDYDYGLAETAKLSNL